MRAVSLGVFILLMCASCEGNLFKKREQPQQPQTKLVTERKIERVACDVSETPVPSEASAANAADGLVEEGELLRLYKQVSARLEGVWQCIERHNKRAEESNGRPDSK